MLISTFKRISSLHTATSHLQKCKGSEKFLQKGSTELIQNFGYTKKN